MLAAAFSTSALAAPMLFPPPLRIVAKAVLADPASAVVVAIASVSPFFFADDAVHLHPIAVLKCCRTVFTTPIASLTSFSLEAVVLLGASTMTGFGILLLELV